MSLCENLTTNEGWTEAKDEVLLTKASDTNLVTVVCIDDFMDPKKRRRVHTRLVYRGPDVEAYVDGWKQVSPDKPYRLYALNGSVLPWDFDRGEYGDLSEFKVSPGDMLFFVDTEDGIEILAAVVIAAAIAAAAIGIATVTSALVIAALVIGGAYLVKQLSTDPYAGDVPSSPRDSQHYTWGPLSNRTHLGGPVPVVMGRIRVAPVLIGYRQTVDENGDNVLNLLYLLSEGPINKIGDRVADFDAVSGASLPDTMEINGQTATVFSDVTCWGRLGEDDQDPIDGFDDDINEFSVDVDLENGSAESYSTTGSVKKFALIIQFPRGLFQIDSQGDTRALNVDWRYRYKKSGGSYSAWVDVRTRNKKTGAFKVIVYQEVAEEGIQDIQVERVTQDHNSLTKTSDMKWEGVQEINPAGFEYPGSSILALEIKATSQLSGDLPTVTVVCEGVKPDDTYSNNPAVLAKEVLTNQNWGGGSFLKNLNVITADFEATRDYCDELIPDGPERKQVDVVDRVADLTAITATGSGDRYVVTSASIYHPGMYVVDVAPGVWQVKTPEPDWVVYATTPDAWYIYNDSTNTWDVWSGDTIKRWEFNAVIDWQTNVWDMVNSIAAAARFSVIRVGDRVRFVPFRMQEPSQYISEDDYDPETLIISYGNVGQAANSVTVEYKDEENDDFRTRPATAEERGIDERGVGRIPESYQLVGITHSRRAINQAYYLMQRGKFVARQIQFEMHFIGLLAEANDVIALSARMPKWGYSGLVREGSDRTRIYMMQPVEFNAGTDYAATIVYGDGTYDKVLRVHNPGSSSSIVRLRDLASKTPDENAVVLVGPLTRMYKKMLLSRVERTSDHKVLVSGPEYHEESFDDDYENAPVNTYVSDYPYDRIPDNVDVLYAREVYDSDNVSSDIYVGWTEVFDAKRYKLFWKEENNDAAVWIELTNTTRNDYRFASPPSNPSGRLFKFAIAPLSMTGNHRPPQDCTQTTLTVYNRYRPVFEPDTDYDEANTGAIRLYTRNDEVVDGQDEYVSDLDPDREPIDWKSDMAEDYIAEIRLGPYWHGSIKLMDYISAYDLNSNDRSHGTSNGQDYDSDLAALRSLPYLAGRDMKLWIRNRNAQGLYSLKATGIAHRDSGMTPYGPRSWSNYDATSFTPYGSHPAGYASPFTFHESGTAAGTHFIQDYAPFSTGVLTNMTWDAADEGLYLDDNEGLAFGLWYSQNIDLGEAGTAGAPWYVYFYPSLRQIWQVLSDYEFWDAYANMDGRLDEDRVWVKIEYRYSDTGSGGWSDWIVYVRDSRIGLIASNPNFPSRYYGHRLGDTSRYIQVRCYVYKDSQNENPKVVDLPLEPGSGGTEPYIPKLENFQVCAWR